VKEIAISEFKAKCLGILEQVAQNAQTGPCNTFWGTSS